MAQRGPPDRAKHWLIDVFGKAGGVGTLASRASAPSICACDKLPKQSIKFQQPFRGQRNDYNNAARWVGVDEPNPVPVKIPNIKQLTQQENEAMLKQYRDAGMIPDGRHGPALGGEVK